ncbi:hypothetical protein [Marimonas lutisalis]|uniref:hypothetical protein n=1 Tax=Marimonas lutisalis TaxID=2545756 RepID=UPI0010F5FED5|nr:hypothetical protein [Marimonas lutisalis]
MTEQSFLQSAVDALQQSSDKISTARDLVVQNGWHWNDELAENSDMLFEIHLFGVAGVGLGAEGAVQNWLENAKAEIDALEDTA